MTTSKERQLETAHGPVRLVTYVTPQQVESWELHPGIGRFGSYRSIIPTKEGLAKTAAEREANLCLALHEEATIVGYCVLRPPQPHDRWAEMDPPILFELLGENARGWRDQGLMRPMLELVVDQPENDHRILYIVGYSWHWDLDETKKTLSQYRDTIISLLSPLGFRQYPTNEPNVCLRPENLFMARLGDALDTPIKRRFTNLLFGMID